MKKRILSLLCLIVVLATTLLPISALGATRAYVYTSNGKTLNMRSAPITHANNRIASIPYGTQVSVEDYVNGKTWAYIKYNGKHGYVQTRYLVSSKPAAHHGNSTSTTPVNNEAISYKNFVQTEYEALVRPSAPGGWVNLRWAPSKKVAVREKVYDGQKLEVISQNSVWAQVRDPETGIVGFIMRSFLTEVTVGSAS